MLSLEVVCTFKEQFERFDLTGRATNTWAGLPNHFRDPAPNASLATEQLRQISIAENQSANLSDGALQPANHYAYNHSWWKNNRRPN